MKYTEGIVDAGLDARIARIGPSPLMELLAGRKVVASGELPARWMERSRRGVVFKAGTWSLRGADTAGNGIDADGFRISGQSETISGSVSLPNEGGDAVMRSVTVSAGQRCTVDDFRIVGGNK